MLARLRGDLAEQQLLADALDLVRAQQIDSDAGLRSLLEQPPPGTSPELLKRLRQLHDAGAWVVVESALADRLEQVEGVVNVPADAVRPLRRIRLHAARPAASNHPTAEGVEGTRQILDLVRGVPP